MAYYMSLFTRETWTEAQEKVAFGVSGHTEAMYHRDDIGPGDCMICWITGDSRAVGVQRITTAAYEDQDPIWQGAIYPIRFGAELVLRVPVDEGVALQDIRDHSQDPGPWSYLFRNPGHRVPDQDAEWIVERLQSNPTQLGSGDPEPGQPVPPLFDPTTGQAAGTPAPAGEEIPPTVKLTGTRTIRDTRVSNWVKEIHHGECQVCGQVLVINGGWYAEGAHIRPLGSPHNGPDVAGNVLCLCPDDHVRLDHGAITLDEEGSIFDASTKKKRGELRRVPQHAINKEHLAYRESMLDEG